MTNAGFDSYGNPADKAYDLGGADDRRLAGERILFCIANAHITYWNSAKTLVKPAVESRNLAMDVVGPDELKRLLRGSKPRLFEYTQLWYLSDAQAYLGADDVRVIGAFNAAGNGVFVWADNDPLYADANLLAAHLAATSFSGDMPADKILEPGPELRRGVFIPHPLTTGLNKLYEGVTICSISPAPFVTILGQSHDGQNCMACFEHGKKRVVLDTGFTKIFGEEYFYRTAGTARYVRNIAFWLAKGARDSQYTLLTTPERLSSVRQGMWSEAFGYNLLETAGLTILLTWQDGSGLELEIKDPSGHAQLLPTKTSPVRHEIDAAAIGVWTFRVYGRKTVVRECPYVLTVVQRARTLAQRPLPRRLLLESHPIAKSEFKSEVVLSDRPVDLRGTAFRIRANVERSADASFLLLVHPGAEVRMKSGGEGAWTVCTSKSSVAFESGSILFDLEGRSPVRITAL